MFCTACGTDLPADAAFCARCGKAQPGHAHGWPAATPSPPIPPGQAALPRGTTPPPASDATPRRLWPWLLLASAVELALLFVGLRPTFLVPHLIGERATDRAWMAGFLLFPVLILGWLGLAGRAAWRRGRATTVLVLACLASLAVGVALAAFGLPGAIDRGGGDAAGGTRLAQMAPTAAADPCAGLDDWVLGFNRELLEITNYFLQTPDPLRGSREDRQTQLELRDRERTAELQSITTWPERHPAPPAAAEYRQLNLDAFEIQRKMFAARTFEEAERITNEELVPVERRIDDAKGKMLDTCNF